MRQWDLLDPSAIDEITIVGAGGVGSTTALLLSKMGFTKIRVYDFDTVEQYNIGSQIYRIRDIGKPKVEALKEIIEDASGLVIDARNEKVAEVKTQVLILAVDNIEARRELAEKSEYEICIDGRMGAETFNAYYFLSEERDIYAKTIFPQGDAEELPCTGKAIAYNTFGLGSIIAALVKKYGSGYIAKNRITGQVIAHAKRLDVLFKETKNKADVTISWLPQKNARYVFRISF